MDTDKTDVDHDAINFAIHKWMYQYRVMLQAPRFTSDYEYVRVMQNRCDELDWQLEYQRRAPIKDGTSCEEYIAMLRPPMVDGNGRRVRRIDKSADTLPLAICLAIVAAIEELKPEPTQVLDITPGDKGRVDRVWLNGKGVRTGDLCSVMRRCRNKNGDDGILFGYGGQVHLANSGQCGSIIEWLICQTEAMKRLERLDKQQKETGK